MRLLCSDSRLFNNASLEEKKDQYTCMYSWSKINFLIWEQQKHAKMHNRNISVINMIIIFIGEVIGKEILTWEVIFMVGIMGNNVLKLYVKKTIQTSLSVFFKQK